MIPGTNRKKGPTARQIPRIVQMKTESQEKGSKQPLFWGTMKSQNQSRNQWKERIITLSLSLCLASKEGEKGKICEHLQFIKYKSRSGLACHVGTLSLFFFWTEISWTRPWNLVALNASHAAYSYGVCLPLFPFYYIISFFVRILVDEMRCTVILYRVHA